MQKAIAAVETYLTELRSIRSSGVGTPETSSYGPLSNLLNEVGKSLKPRIHCILSVTGHGAGIPDGGLFSPPQLRQVDLTAPLKGEPPAHGVIEVKSTEDDAWLTADSKQVSKYWDRYRQVLVTNYRDFLLVSEDAEGTQTTDEHFRLAPDEKSFWQALEHPRKLAEEKGDRFIEFLKRVMLHTATITEPEDVAWFLASHARDALSRLEHASNTDSLSALRRELEAALDLKFDDQSGRHFLRSALVQTLFYGLFSAWVLWHKENPSRKARFDWRTSAHYLSIPVIRRLFHAIAEPGQLREPDLTEPLRWSEAALNRVDRGRFFSKFEEGHAVQYFYEPFLKEFDPELRKTLGVWYTPPEVVQYMVARVDTVLREELGIEDGLADEHVYVLDPCCGTGAFLVEVLRRIEATIKAKSPDDALAASDVKKAAMSRVFGFEILPAPFIVSHLQLGLLLQSVGAPLVEESGERASVYLTNALTGWEPTKGPKKLLFDETRAECEAADHIKRDRDILVILGNPPYDGYAGVAIGEERGLTEAYRKTNRAPAPQGQGLNDPYVRFFRMAERRIVEMTGKGVVCFISNNSWLDRLSFTGMREHYLDAFDNIWVDCLNGDKYGTGKLTPDGKPDPSIFSTDSDPVGIQVGTTVSLLVRRAQHNEASHVRFRHLWGTKKREQLRAEATLSHPPSYELITPPLELGLPFMPVVVGADYLSWPLLTGLFQVSFPGVKTSRDDFLVDIDRERLEGRVRLYFDRSISHERMRELVPGVMTDTARFKAALTRAELSHRGQKPDGIVPYYYRPFDIRWLYWEPDMKLLDEKRTEYKPHVVAGNVWLEARQHEPGSDFSRGTVVECLADNFGNGLSHWFPAYLVCDPATRKHHPESAAPAGTLSNMSEWASKYTSEMGTDTLVLFHHCVSTLHTPDYRRENADALRLNWPRIPLPAERALLAKSAELGLQVAALLDLERPVQGVTSGSLRPELAPVAVPAREGGGSWNPSKGDLAVTAGWGHRGQGGVTMPGTGKAVARDYTAEELAAIRQGAKSLGLSQEAVFECVGKTTHDVYLNQSCYWRNVPAGIWEYTLGGYQVLKKWLSYRERELLDRDLKPEEAREVSSIVRRIAAILLLGPALDANYKAVKESTYKWPTAAEIKRP